MSEDAMMPGELRFYQAYLMMAKEPNYRPAAPGDGMGNTYLTKTQAAEGEHLSREARTYAARLRLEEDSRQFMIGCSNYESNRAFVFVIEAARALCGVYDDLGLDLLKMPVKELEECGVRSGSGRKIG